jgi:hypothetical protein
MTLDLITAAFGKGIAASDEAMKGLSQEEIFQQALKNSRNPHENSSKAISSTLRGTGSISTTATASSTTRARAGK